MANLPARATIDVGSVIADTYTIEALLGRGGMGAVFLASHRRLAGKQVAIKILHTELAEPDIIARFKREAEIAAKLNHPNIVGVIDYNVSPDGMPYLVLDYLEGETLAERIARGPLTLDQATSIVRQIGSALAAAHRAGIVHRDLKPQNIFLVPSEVDGRHVEIAKVLDFGISKIRGSQTVKTQDSTLLGTPQYMAPEQATGQHTAVDERTDLFALGAIVYEMLAGAPAFSGASIPAVVFQVVYEQPAPLAERAPGLPPGVVAAIAQAMAKKPDERFANVAAFVEALTGQPLTVVRGQVPAGPAAADSPSAARRVATREAFDQTVGSGDHGASPIDPRLAPMLASATPAPGAPVPRTPTAHPPSQAGASPEMASMATAYAGAAPGPASVHAPVPMPAPTSSPAPSPGHITAVPKENLHSSSRAPRTGLSVGAIAAIVLVGAALAGGGVYLAVRKEPAAAIAPVAPAPAAAPPAATSQPSAPGQRLASTEPGSTATGSTAAGSATGSAAAGSAAADTTGSASEPPPPPKKIKPTETKPPEPKPADSKLATPPIRPAVHDEPPTTPDDETGDETARAKLEQANAALDRHDYDQAEHMANAVLNGPSGPKQRAAARLIHGTVQCLARNDQEAAQIDLRNLDGFRGMKIRLVNVCKQHGVTLSP